MPDGVSPQEQLPSALLMRRCWLAVPLRSGRGGSISDACGAAGVDRTLDLTLTKGALYH